MAVLTDDDIIAGIPSISVVDSGSLEELVKNGVNDAVKTICQRTFIKTTFTRERYTVRPARQRGGIVIQFADKIRLRNYPVIEGVSDPFVLEVESSIDAQGETDGVSVVDRTSFLVERDLGIVSLRSVTISSDQLFSSGSFPSTRGVILMTYNAGYIAADMPGDLVMAAVHLYGRIWDNFKNQRQMEAGSQTDFGTKELVRAQIAPEELMVFKRYRRLIAA